MKTNKKDIMASSSSGLVIVDVGTDPANPAIVGSYKAAGLAYGVTLSPGGNSAYIADAGNGLVVIDVGTDPANPSLK